MEMAKSSDGVVEMKEELQRLVKAIADGEEFELTKAMDEAISTLCSLRDEKLKDMNAGYFVPPEFRCPISKEVMRDPVVLANGETYDRTSIQKWLNQINEIRTPSQQVLSHTVFFPNQVVREMISQWCKEEGFEFPNPKPVHHTDEEVARIMISKWRKERGIEFPAPTQDVEFGVAKTDGVVVTKAMQLKKELQTLVKAIVDEDEYPLTSADKAIITLCCLKVLKLKRLNAGCVVPPLFRCPISKELMRDPVVLANGQTYDRLFIQRWLNQLNQIHPQTQTQQFLSQRAIIPNEVVREMISQWCKEQGIEFPNPVQHIDEKVLRERISKWCEEQGLEFPLPAPDTGEKVARDMISKWHNL